MLNKIKKSTGLEWGELTSILVVICVGLSFIYKVGFYNGLGVGWYINTGSAFTIFVSSISVIFWGVSGLILGYLTFLGIKEIQNTRLRTIFPLILNVTVATILVIMIISMNFSDSTVWFVKFNLTGLMITLVLYNIFITIISTNHEMNIIGVVNEKRFIVSGTFLLLLYAFLAWGFGQTQAKNVLEYREEILNKVSLDQSKDNWYLVDYTGDKVLLLKEGSGMIFKVVEYKDLKEISPPDQKS